jgi:NAD-dependent dihydropyrimidine dehydrogenase PreA subunit
MHEDVYLNLREHLDSLPGGYPTTDSGVEMRILEKLFTPEDARMAVCLSREPDSPAAIARKRGVPESEAAEQLESMARRGLILRVRNEGEVLYGAVQFMVGIYEHQSVSMDREFAELAEEYLLYVGMAQGQNETEQMRVIPVASTIDVTSDIATYDQIRELVGEKRVISVSPCVCRKQQGALGNECERPWDACMRFGEMAEYYIENGWGRRLSPEEALRALDLAEEQGLVLMPDNAQDIEFVCSCCSCCCAWLRTFKMFPNPAEFLRSNYCAVKDLENCTACLTCIERCPMDAVQRVRAGRRDRPGKVHRLRGLPFHLPGESDITGPQRTDSDSACEFRGKAGPDNGGERPGLAALSCGGAEPAAFDIAT